MREYDDDDNDDDGDDDDGKRWGQFGEEMGCFGQSRRAREGTVEEGKEEG